MRKIVTLAPIVLLLITAGSLPNRSQAAWSGGVEGGSVIRDGESASRIRVRASLDERPLSHYLYAEWLKSGTDSYEFGYRPRYWIDQKRYVFGEGRLRLEEALGIDRETLLLAGVGMQITATDERRVSLEAGLGVRSIDYTGEFALEDSAEDVVVLRGDASQVLSDLVRLEFDADLYRSPSFIQSQVELGVSFRLQQGAVRLSYRVRRVEFDEQQAVNDSDSAVAFTVGF